MRLLVPTPIIALVIWALLVGSLAAQQTAPCSGGASSAQFNFWIGEWSVTSGGQVAGANSIQPILDGCVLQETWSGAGGSKGSSFNFYNPTTRKWQQFWVWKNGTTLELEGEFKEGKMVLGGESLTQKGEKRLNRITWYDNPDKTVRQHWEVSPDGGKTWTTAFDGLYARKN